jgi:hypothetical protein
LGEGLILLTKLLVELHYLPQLFLEFRDVHDGNIIRSAR